MFSKGKVFGVLLMTVAAWPLQSFAGTVWNFAFNSATCGQIGCSTPGAATLYEQTNNICITGTFTREATGFLVFVVSSSTAPYQGGGAPSNYVCPSSGGTSCHTVSNGTCDNTNPNSTACNSLAAGVKAVCQYTPAAGAKINIIELPALADIAQPILVSNPTPSASDPDGQLVVAAINPACPLDSGTDLEDASSNPLQWNVVNAQWNTAMDPTQSTTNMGQIVSVSYCNNGGNASCTTGNSLTQITLDSSFNTYYNPATDSAGDGSPYTTVTGMPSNVVMLSSTHLCSNGQIVFDNGYTGSDHNGTLYISKSNSRINGAIFQSQAKHTIFGAPAQSVGNLSSLLGYYAGFTQDLNSGTPLIYPVRVSVNVSGNWGDSTRLSDATGTNGTTLNNCGAGGNTSCAAAYSLHIDFSNAVNTNSGSPSPGFVRGHMTNNLLGSSYTQNVLCAVLIDSPPFATQNIRGNTLICSGAAPESATESNLAQRAFNMILTSAKAGDGYQDLTYGSSGYMTRDINGQDWISAILVYPNFSWDTAGNLAGKTLIAGTSNYNTSTAKFELARYQINGVLDSGGAVGFNTGGTTPGTYSVTAGVVSTSAKQPYLAGAYIDSAGRVVIAGRNQQTIGKTGTFYVTVHERFTSTGTLDTTYSTGLVTQHVDSGNDRPLDVEEQSSGKVLIFEGNSNAGMISRYTTGPNAALDATFGASGIFTVPNGPSNGNQAASMKICYDYINSAGVCGAPSGTDLDKIYTFGNAINSTGGTSNHGYGYVSRFTAANSPALDSTAFNTAGIIYHNSHSPDQSAGSGSGVAANQGTVWIDMQNTTIQTVSQTDINAIDIDTAGNIYAVGDVFYSNNTDSFIAKIKNDGTLDSTFNSAGDPPGTWTLELNTVSSTYDSFFAVKVQADGRIVAIGDNEQYGAPSGTPSCFAARFNTNGTLDTTFAGDPTNAANLLHPGVVYYAPSTSTECNVHLAAGALNTGKGLGAGLLSIAPDGRIVFGGNFNTSSGALDSTAQDFWWVRIWP